MINNNRMTSRYDYRVVKKQDTHLCKSIYVLCECHYDDNGKISTVSIVDDMTGYSRSDATEFLLRMSGATLRPVINESGAEVEPSLIDPGRAIIGAMLSSGSMHDKE